MTNSRDSRKKKMEYISRFERIGMEKGWRKGATRVLQLIVSQRFHVSKDSLENICEGLSKEQIKSLAKRFLEAESLDELRKWADEMRKSSSDDS